MTQFTIVPNPRTAEDFARNWIAKNNDANSNLTYLKEMFLEYGSIIFSDGYDRGYDDGANGESDHLSSYNNHGALESLDLHDNTT